MGRKKLDISHEEMKLRKQTQNLKAVARYRENPEFRTYLRNYDLFRRFGITLEDYNRMFEEQEGKCKICGKHQSESKKAFAVDHNHITGKVRGLLCDNCNRGIGCLQDNTEILEKAIDYLNDSKEKTN